MFLALHGQDTEETKGTDPFLFFLAEKLHKSVTEIRGLPALEIKQWAAYYKVKRARDELAERVAANGR